MPRVYTRIPPEQRFWRKVDTSAGPDGCWLWTARRNNKGYGMFDTGTRTVLAHRFAYELLLGPIPEGLELDHVRARGCSYRHCVSPAHLQPVSHRVNMLRGTATRSHCIHGHAFTPENTYVYQGTRRCAACHRRRARQSYMKRRGVR